MEDKLCIYCGVKHFSNRCSCTDCGRRLNGKFVESFSHACTMILESLLGTPKIKKQLALPKWKQVDIDALDHGLKDSVEYCIIKRGELMSRIKALKDGVKKV